MNPLKEMSFRTNFQTKAKILKWFPRHMGKGLRQMENTLRKVDCVLEVHDSRIPFSGRNLHFVRNWSSVKPHILLMNKIDLLDLRFRNKIKDRLEENNGNTRCLFINSMEPNSRINGFPEILPTVLDSVRSSDRFNREDFNEFNLMIIGIPNVGKSTIINKLRSNYLKVGGKPAAVGAIAGITRSVMERIKINANPPIYLYDTPGVLEPKIDNNIETTMRCALCATLSDDLIGIQNIADYLLYWLNRRNIQSYVEFLKLDKPSDDITEVLIKGAVGLKCLVDVKDPNTGILGKRPDLERTAQVFVSAFRKGKLGRFLLDDDLI